LRVPSGTQRADVFRVAAGLPPARVGRRLHVQTYIECPKTYAAADKLLRELAELEQSEVSPHRKSFLERLKEYSRPASQRDHNEAVGTDHAAASDDNAVNDARWRASPRGAVERSQDKQGPTFGADKKVATWSSNFARPTSEPCGKRRAGELSQASTRELAEERRYAVVRSFGPTGRRRQP